jgi:dihydrolipoamide dehydrogenase
MYDLIIIGAGPAGYYAAEFAGKSGLSVSLIEKEYLGGVCLNQGCIPTKALLYCSKLYYLAKNSQKFGIKAENVEFDLQTAMIRKQKIVETLRKGIEFSLKKNKVNIINGIGKIIGKGKDIFKVKVNNEILETKNLFIATGSKPIIPNIEGINKPFVVTNKEILNINFIPSSLVIIGGGAIGLEFAVFFSELGSHVSVVEMLSDIGGKLDKEISLILKKELEKKGIEFFLNSKVVKIGENEVIIESDKNQNKISCNLVLVSIGRKPDFEGLGLENIGNVEIINGAIKTNSNLATNIMGLWAAGDVNGVSMLAHTAYREARVCIENILGKDSFVNYNAIPSVIFTHPEVAYVGFTKENALKEGINAIEVKLPNTYNGRYIAETDMERGITKAVIDSKDKKIIGIHMIGGNCSEMIYGAASMIENNMKAEDVSKIVFPHPTVSEIIKDTIMLYE